MVTVFFGADAPETARAAVEARLRADHPCAEVYTVDGGQDVYPFIFTVE